MMAGIIDEAMGPPSPRGIPSEERLLAAALVALPVITFFITKLVHGAIVGRYVLASALGISIALAFAVSGVRRLATATLALLVCVFLFQQSEGWRFGRASAVASQKFPDLAMLSEMNQGSDRANLPTVISGGLTFMAMAYYGASSSESPSFVYVADRDNALRYIGTDSVDRTLLAIQPYAHLPVEKLADFLQRHQRFLVYSLNDPTWEWLIRQQLADGSSVRLVKGDGSHSLYLVDRSDLSGESPQASR